MMGGGHVSPVVPGGYPHLTGQFVDAEDGTAAVTADDDELVSDDLNEVHLTLALERADIEAVVTDQAVDERGVPKCTNEDGGSVSSTPGCCGRYGGGDALGLDTGDTADIDTEAAHSAGHATLVGGIDKEGGRHATDNVT